MQPCAGQVLLKYKSLLLKIVGNEAKNVAHLEKFSCIYLIMDDFFLS